MNNPYKQETIYVPVWHGAITLESLKPYHCGTLIDFWLLNDLMTDELAEEVVKDVATYLPRLPREVVFQREFWGNTIDVYKGETIKLCGALDEEAKRAIPIIYESGADGTHYDYIPSYVEEFIIACRQLAYLLPIQVLYDSLWSEHNAYYPLKEDANDPGLYSAFEDIGIELHKDHPIEPFELDYLESIARVDPLRFESYAKVACEIAIKRGDFSETVNYYKAACKHSPKIKYMYDRGMELYKHD